MLIYYFYKVYWVFGELNEFYVEIVTFQDCLRIQKQFYYSLKVQRVVSLLNFRSRTLLGRFFLIKFILCLQSAWHSELIYNQNYPLLSLNFITLR